HCPCQINSRGGVRAMRATMLLSMVVCLACGVAISSRAGASQNQPPADGKVQELLADLKNPQKNKGTTVEALGELKARAAPAVPELIRLFPGKDELPRLQSAIALGQIAKP